METNAEYHADTESIGASMLRTFRKSPAGYYGTYIAGTIPRLIPTPAMVMGSLAHCLLLEPGTFDDLYIVAAGCDSRRGKKWAAVAELAEAERKTAVLPSYVTVARGIVASVRANSQAAELLELEGVHEVALRCEHETGLTIKCKPDLLVIDDRLECVTDCDFKTTADPGLHAWGNQGARLGYPEAAAHYGDIVRKVYGRPYERLWIVAGSTPPYDVYVRPCPGDVLAKASLTNAEAMARLAACYESGEWIHPDQNRLQPAWFPGWAGG